jgi:hypothetical protein
VVANIKTRKEEQKHKMSEKNEHAITKDLLGIQPKHVYLTKPSDFPHWKAALETAGSLLLPTGVTRFASGGHSIDK